MPVAKHTMRPYILWLAGSFAMLILGCGAGWSAMTLLRQYLYSTINTNVLPDQASLFIDVQSELLGALSAGTTIALVSGAVLWPRMITKQRLLTWLSLHGLATVTSMVLIRATSILYQEPGIGRYSVSLGNALITGAIIGYIQSLLAPRDGIRVKLWILTVAGSAGALYLFVLGCALLVVMPD